MSRSLTIDDHKLEELKQFALNYHLNTRDLPFHRTEQFTCRNSLRV